jgi:hypothetical protein
MPVEAVAPSPKFQSMVVPGTRAGFEGVRVKVTVWPAAGFAGVKVTEANKPAAKKKVANKEASLSRGCFIGLLQTPAKCRL